MEWGFDIKIHKNAATKINQYLKNIYSLSGDESSDVKEMRTRVPQGSMLRPIMYLLFISDSPTLYSTVNKLLFTIQYSYMFTEATVPFTIYQHQRNSIKKIARKKLWSLKLDQTMEGHTQRTLVNKSKF